ncbi:hypothetical protein, partial [Synechococcus sp. HK01-R]|uniref:hypothetical protein n=1 Tax=Synechococcus sp. HK01-R TaxID=2751171 RepID=UPI00185F87A8
QIDLNGENNTGTGYQSSYSVGQVSAVSITGLDTSIFDVDDANIESAVITLVNAQAGDQLVIDNLPDGIEARFVESTEGSIRIELTGSASKAIYAQGLQSIGFINRLENPSTIARTLEISVNDGDESSNTAISSLQVIGINSLNAPSTKTIEGSDLIFDVQLTATPVSDVDFSLSIGDESTAISGVDYKSVPAFTNGVRWMGNDPKSGRITVPAGVESFNIVFTTNDDLVVEGTETVVLKLASVSAVGQITDGSGSFLAINNITVNEGSPTAVFRVEGVEGQELRLNLEGYIDDTEAGQGEFNAGAKAATMTGNGADLDSFLEVYNGQTWEPYVPGSFVRYPTGSTTLLVRVDLRNDIESEGREAFKLIAEAKAIDPIASDDGNLIRVAGIGIIADDGRGPFFNEAGSENYDVVRDDDRRIKISSININEGSSYGIFTVANNEVSDQEIKLSVQDSPNSGFETGQRDLKPGESSAFSPDQLSNKVLEYWDNENNGWVQFTQQDFVPIKGNSLLYVRLDTSSEQDDVFEGQVGESSIGETFKLVATNNNGEELSFGIGQILDDGTGIKYTGDIADGSPVTSTSDLDDDLDKDGIAPNVEEILATQAFSVGQGGQAGDLNNDGIQDAEQAAVSTLAWIKATNLELAKTGELLDVKPIVSIVVETSADANQVEEAGAADSKYQLQNVNVVSQESEIFRGSKPTQTKNELETIEANWDPILFDIQKKEDALELVDADPTREGTQIIVTIDIARSGTKEGDFNAYLKFVSDDVIQTAIDNNIDLRDLDGNPITEPGWIDFTRRQDASGNYTGDGAQFIVEDIGGQRMITKIRLTFTDNKFGDNDLLNTGVKDPGLPVRRTLRIQDAQADSTPEPQPSRPNLQEPEDEPLPPVTPEVTPDAPVSADAPPVTPDAPVSADAPVTPTEPTPSREIEAEEIEEEPTTVQKFTSNEARRLTPLVAVAEVEEITRRTTAAQENVDENNVQATNLFMDVPYDETKLVRELVLQSQDTLINWAANARIIAGGNRGESVLNGRDTVKGSTNKDHGPSEIAGEAALGPNSRRPSVAGALSTSELGLEPRLGNGLLDTILLGGGVLYAFNRFNTNKVTSWVNQLLAKSPKYYAGAGQYERVITVFLMASETGLQRLIAARVTDEQIEILAEQILPMSLSAAAAPSQADLDRELQQLVKKVTDQTNSSHDLLLFDPKLREDLPIYESLGNDDHELQPKSLHAILNKLNPDELSDLRQWISRPSSCTIDNHPIANRLKQRQHQLRKLVNHDKSRLVSMLELCLAMAQPMA